MITIPVHALINLGFNPDSPMSAVQVVRTQITSDDAVKIRRGEGVDLINRLLGTTTDYATLMAGVAERLLGDYELMLTQAVAEAVVRANGEPIDEDTLMDHAKARVMRLMTSPTHQWLFAKVAPAGSPNGPGVAVVADLDVKVEVKADGSIKKGGREVLAKALYQKRVIDSGAPVTNQEFVKMLCDELSMTKSGATTYAYNIDKQMGGKLVKKVRNAK